MLYTVQKPKIVEISRVQHQHCTASFVSFSLTLCMASLLSGMPAHAFSKLIPLPTNHLHTPPPKTPTDPVYKSGDCCCVAHSLYDSYSLSLSAAVGVSQWIHRATGLAFLSMIMHIYNHNASRGMLALYDTKGGYNPIYVQIMKYLYRMSTWIALILCIFLFS